MSDHVDRTIQEACAEVDRLNAELVHKKHGVNTICELFNRPPVYTDLDTPKKTTGPNGSRPDRYVGRPLATVVRNILTARHESNVGPAIVDDLYAEMLAGGYDFEGKSDENSKRALAVSLAKNTTVFRRLGNGMWGLTEWYGGKQAKTAKKKPEAESAGTTDESAAELPDAFDMESKAELEEFDLDLSDVAADPLKNSKG